MWKLFPLVTGKSACKYRESEGKTKQKVCFVYTDPTLTKLAVTAILGFVFSLHHYNNIGMGLAIDHLFI